MKTYIKITFLLICTFFVSSINGQNLVFDYVKASSAPGETTVYISVTNEGAESENIGAFAIQLYYDSNETSVTSSDFSPVAVDFGWGTTNATVVPFESQTDDDVLINHTGYFNYQNFDFENFTGVDIPANANVPIGSIVFNNAGGSSETDGGEVWLAEGDEITGLTYSDINFAPEHPIQVNESNQQQLLPIIVKTFSATKIEKTVDLNWVTSSEINGSHFEVERSRDLESWSKIGEVKAVGESTIEQSYNLLDNTLPFNARDSKRIFYYRLNMVDNDGTQEYSDIRTVRFDIEGTDFLVYPNPAFNDVFVSLSSITTETGPVQMNVVNSQGQLVKKVQLMSNDDVNVDISDINAGVYYFIVTQGEETHTQKIIKVN